MEYVILYGVLRNGFSILELIPFQERIHTPHLGPDCMKPELAQFKVSDVPFEVDPVGRIDRGKGVEIEHWSYLHRAQI